MARILTGWRLGFFRRPKLTPRRAWRFWGGSSPSRRKAHWTPLLPFVMSMKPRIKWSWCSRAGGRRSFSETLNLQRRSAVIRLRRSIRRSRHLLALSPPPRPSTRGWSRRQRSAATQGASGGERPADIQTARIGPHPGQCFGTPLCRRKNNHARFCSPAFRNRFHWWNG
jgi:hypothetical protein